jgi:hypothetical protein
MNIYALINPTNADFVRNANGKVVFVVRGGTTPAVHVNEGDVITFTPSDGTGAGIGGTFTAVITKYN